MLKGIILAGGANKRLHPLTVGVCKQLLPVYDKPMIFYPLSTLLRCRCREILIIVRCEADMQAMVELLPHRSLGVDIKFAIQPEPRGLADAFLIAKDRDFMRPSDYVALILGDNLLDGGGFPEFVLRPKRSATAQVFFHRVADPARYGVGKFEGEKLVRIVEKPDVPPSNWAQVGLYVYDYAVLQIAADLKPSARGELEITDVNNTYLEMDALDHFKLPRGVAWLDMGTYDDLLGAGHYVATIQQRRGTMVGCPAIAALDAALITPQQALAWASRFDSGYGRELKRHLDARQNQVCVTAPVR